MPEVIFNQSDIAIIDNKMIDKLKTEAFLCSYKRSRYCLHSSTKETFHEMINVFWNETYIRPHRHPIKKSESYQIVEGELLICIFKDDGELQDQILLTPYNKTDSNFLLRLNTNFWHMQIVLTECVVFIESYQGPFTRQNDVEEAIWSPIPSENEKVEALISRMKNIYFSKVKNKTRC